MDEIDMEMLISEVKKYREIWDMKCELYHDKHRKRSSWMKIISVVDPTFEEKSQKEKEDVGNLVMKKWKNTRDNFLKTLKKKKSGDGATAARSYLYARQLSFLVGNISPANTVSSLDEENNHRDETSDVHLTKNAQSLSQAQPPLTKKNKTAHCSQLEERLLRFMDAPEPQQPKQNPLLKFFESLEPVFETFSVDDQLEVQAKVLEIVTKIRRRSATAHHPQYQPPRDSSHRAVNYLLQQNSLSQLNFQTDRQNQDAGVYYEDISNKIRSQPIPAHRTNDTSGTSQEGSPHCSEDDFPLFSQGK